MLETITIDTEQWAVVPRAPTIDMLYAMAECDGHLRGDRDHPTLARWEDYWIMALSALPKPEQAQQSDAEFHRGAKAVFDYMLCRAANNYHGNPEIQKQCDIENKAVTEWIEEALEDVSPESLMEWKSIALLCREISALKAQQSDPRPVPTCDWQEDSDGIWETSCGEAWVCTEGTPAENNMKFCHSCGKHLKEHRYAEPDGGAV